MNGRRPAWAIARCGFAVVLSAAAHAADLLPRRLYEMSTRTGMPHLEENLRYAVVTQQRCLSPHDLSSVFWMLDEVSLQDCRLIEVVDDKRLDPQTTALYKLRCTGGHGTSGEAQWELAAQQLTGVLNVRLGGKNMTFYQRITAKPIGDCP
ncbi:MAG: hypothetical protein WA210_22785 [Burkholderiaceae bacterium]